jgi:hypothetical protein
VLRANCSIWSIADLKISGGTHQRSQLLYSPIDRAFDVVRATAFTELASFERRQPRFTPLSE